MLTFLLRKKPHKPHCYLILFTTNATSFFQRPFPFWKATKYEIGAKCYPINPCPSSVCATLHAEERLKWGSLCLSLWSLSIVSLHLHIQTSILILLLHLKFCDHRVLGPEQILSNLMCKCRNACRSPFCGPMYLFSLCRLPLIPIEYPVLWQYSYIQNLKSQA